MVTNVATIIVDGMVVFLHVVVVGLLPSFVDGSMVMVG
jgi:hypothetical protein